MKNTPTTQCPTCGAELSADEIFCNSCFTMNPMVRDFLERNPKPYPKDYMTVDSTCPYCSKRQRNRVIDEFLTKTSVHLSIAAKNAEAILYKPRDWNGVSHHPRSEAKSGYSPTF